MLFAVSAFAEEEMATVHRRLLINGTHQRFVPFQFDIPWSAGGVLKVYQFQKSQPFFGEIGKWVLKNPGERVSMGVYRFEIVGADMKLRPPVVDIVVKLPRWQVEVGVGGFMEIEPEDLGLLAKNGNTPNNAFNLSTDDAKYSYEIVCNSIGSERSLDSFRQNTGSFPDSGRNIVGAVVADSRGFLTKKVMFDQNSDPVTASMLLKGKIPRGLFANPWVKKIIGSLEPRLEKTPKPEDIIVNEGDVVILIRDETLPY